MHFRGIIVLLVVALFAGTSVPSVAARDDSQLGIVVTARARGDAFLIWDASVLVGEIVNERMPSSQGIARLNAAAAQILSRKAALLRRNARTISLDVVYAKSGAVSPVYGASAFSGREHVSLLRASINDAVKYGSGWSHSVRTGKSPRGLQITATGGLPPPR